MNNRKSFIIGLKSTTLSNKKKKFICSNSAPYFRRVLVLPEDGLYIGLREPTVRGPIGPPRLSAASGWINILFNSFDSYIGN